MTLDRKEDTMLKIQVPGFGEITIAQVVFDYNGTLAIGGKLIAGVGEAMNALSGILDFHVVTADTFGFVRSELQGINCKLAIIPEERQAEAKLDYASKLGLDKTMCVGNGRNDRLMLKEAVLGVGLLQEEGAFPETLFSSDLICNHILDVFAFLKEPRRLIASLRS